jgi:hypothetical protein
MLVGRGGSGIRRAADRRAANYGRRGAAVADARLASPLRSAACATAAATAGATVRLKTLGTM